MQNVDIGIDLGTSHIRIYIPEKGIVLNEPSVLTVNNDTLDIIAIGREAYYMIGRTSERLSTVYPLRNGVITNYDFTEILLTECIKKVCGNRVFMPRVVVCVPNAVTELERRSVCRAIHSAGARRVCLIGETIAAATGANLDVSRPKGCMVVDIGAGTTDIAVMSLNDTASSDSVKIAGNEFDRAITEYIKNNFDLIIGPKTAERVKKQLGGAIPRDFKTTAKISGICTSTRLPKSITLSSDDIYGALEEPAITIVRHIQRVIEKTPPELVGDIHTDGIVLTGGGSKLYGIDKLIEKKTKLNVVVANEPDLCVIHGAGAALKHMDDYSEEKYGVTPLSFYKDSFRNVQG